MNVLQVENLIRSYRKSVIKESEEDVKVLKGISFQVTEGEFVGIMGKSGCGKTTLLKTLGMIDKPTDGTIKFMGEDTSELYGDKLADIRNSKIGFIFQAYNLIPTLTCKENIELPSLYSRTGPQDIDLLSGILNISHLLDKKTAYLSGGEKQRVAIARALVLNPSLIIADEPTGNLDEVNTKEVLNILKNENDKGRAIIVITHDMKVALNAKRRYRLEEGVLREIT